MADDIKLNIKATVGVDTGPAAEDIAKLRRDAAQPPPGGGPGPGVSGRSYAASPTEMAAGAIEKQTQAALREFYGQNQIQRGHYLRDHEKITRLHREQNAILQDMRKTYQEISKSTDPMVRAGLPGRARDIREQDRLVKAIYHDRLVQQSSEREAGVGGAEGAGVGNLTNGMGIGQLAKGGLLWRGAAAAGAMAVANPSVALGIGIPAALLAGVKLFEHAADQMAEYGEGIGLSFLNTARRTGTADMRGHFETPGGTTRKQFLAMGYSGEHLAKTLDAYGMPGSPEAVGASVYAQGRFARAYGYGEQPEYIAGMGRRATQLGVGEPGAGQEHYWNMMASAIEKGTRHGVDATDKMRALVGLTEQVATHTGIVSQREFSGLAGMMSALEGPAGGSRFFKGERGTQYAAQIMEGIANPKEIAQQRLVQTVIAREFGGRVPTAKEAGITDRDEARQYDRMTEIQQLQYIQGHLHGNTKLLAKLATALEGAAGQTKYGSSLLFEGMTGVDAAKQPAAYKALAEAGRTQGMKQSEIEKLGLFGLYGAVLEKASSKEMAAIFKGLTPKDGTTDVERARATSLSNQEAFSKQVGEHLLASRLSLKNIEGAALAYIGQASGYKQGSFGERLSLPSAEARADARKQMARKPTEQMQGRPVSPELTDDMREMIETNPRLRLRDGRVDATQLKLVDPERATASSVLSTQRRRDLPGQTQADPASMPPLKVEVGGTITVTGDALQEGTVQVPAHQLIDLLNRQVAVQEDEQARGRGLRPNAIQRGAP